MSNFCNYILRVGFGSHAEVRQVLVAAAADSRNAVCCTFRLGGVALLLDICYLWIEAGLSVSEK